MFTLLIQYLTAMNAFFDSWKKAVFAIGFSFFFFLGSIFMPKYLDESTDYITAINARISINTSVMDILSAANQDLHANRLVISELHDGKQNVSGVKFAFVSATYELVQPGTAKIILELQNLPTSMFTGYWKVMNKGECYKMNIDLDNLESNVDAPTNSYATYGVDYAMTCPIFEPRTGLILGTITGFWNKDLNANEIKADEDKLIKTSLVLSGLLSGNAFKHSWWDDFFGEPK